MNTIRQLLTEFMVKTNKLEIQAQHIRQNIAKNPYFQIVSVFERFDKFRKGYIVPSDFSEFMLQNNLYPTEAELYLIFKDFDKKKLGMVTLDQFQQEILPKQHKKLKNQALSRKPYQVQLRLSLDLEYLLAKYFDDKIKSIRELNVIRDRLKFIQTCSTEEAFILVDQNKNGYISTLEEIDNFLRKNGKQLNKEELNRIYRNLTNQTFGEITYQIFRDNLDPFYVGFYHGYAQKVSEKKMQEKLFLEKKYQVEREKAINIQKSFELEANLATIQESNRRLHQILGQQELERKLHSPYY